jgi:hypothetical protein
LHLIRKPVGWTSGWVMILSAGASSAVKTRAALQPENFALRHQIGSFNGLRRSARSCTHLTDSCGFGGRACGQVGLGASYCEAGNRICQAPQRISPFLDVEDPERQAMAAAGPTRGPRSHPPREQRNPGWGAPRIYGELLKLGINVGETSVSKYLVRNPKPPSQTWRTFLENHVKSLVSVDFFTVPTIRFQAQYVFLVLAHERRRIVHFAVTAHPTARVGCAAASGSFSVGQRAALPAARS